MTILRNKTFRMRPQDVERRWWHVDATDQVLGKLAVRVAMTLMGKDRPTVTPGVDTGDFVVVTNAEKVRLTGGKGTGKVHRYYTGYIGGLVEQTYDELRAKKPEKLIELAVRRMLPKTKLGRKMFKRLKVYPGSEHPHAAQAPAELPARTD